MGVIGRRGNEVIRLVDLNKHNYMGYLNLKVQPEQEQHVSPNVFTMAQFAFEDRAKLWGIAAGEEPVGLAMLRVMDASDEFSGTVGLKIVDQPFLGRLMIAAASQGRGYGRLALNQICSWAEQLPDADRIYVTHTEGQGNPGTFYERCGFRSLGRHLGGELLRCREFKSEATPIKER